ncbi:hypothetical protein C0J52_27945 [Blattella germanica]|nr:hypothetical protein C0J52_27945 [Blattella germanica]
MKKSISTEGSIKTADIFAIDQQHKMGYILDPTVRSESDATQAMEVHEEKQTHSCVFIATKIAEGYVNLRCISTIPRFESGTSQTVNWVTSAFAVANIPKLKVNRNSCKAIPLNFYA